MSDTATTDLDEAGLAFAVEYVESIDWRVLACNWKCRQGSLDVVAADGEQIIVIQVRACRTRTYIDPAMLLAGENLSRVRALARRWIAAQQTIEPWQTIRFDAIIVRLPEGSATGDQVRIVHRTAPHS